MTRCDSTSRVTPLPPYKSCSLVRLPLASRSRIQTTIYRDDESCQAESTISVASEWGRSFESEKIWHAAPRRSPCRVPAPPQHPTTPSPPSSLLSEWHPRKVDSLQLRRTLGSVRPGRPSTRSSSTTGSSPSSKREVSSPPTTSEVRPFPFDDSRLIVPVVLTLRGLVL